MLDFLKEAGLIFLWSFPAALWIMIVARFLFKRQVSFPYAFWGAFYAFGSGAIAWFLYWWFNEWRFGDRRITDEGFMWLTVLGVAVALIWIPTWFMNITIEDRSGNALGLWRCAILLITMLVVVVLYGFYQGMALI